jgi:protease II
MLNLRRILVQSGVPLRGCRISAMIAWGMLAAGGSIAQKPVAPPIAPVRVITEEYFGTKVSDPYRYMENLKDPEVVQWFKEQDDYTRLVLSRIPGRAALLARIQQLDQSGPPRVFDVQRFQNEHYFYQKRLPDEDIAKLYERNGLEGPEKLLLDPDKYVMKPGEHYSLNYYVPYGACIWGKDFLSVCRPCLELQDLPASAFYGVELKHVLDVGMCKIQPLPTSLPNSLRGHGS